MSLLSRLTRLSLASALVSVPALALADTSQIDISALPSMTVYDVAEVTPLAVSAEGSPAVILLDLDAGDVVPPHATDSGLRLLTVISGEVSWGDGDMIDEGAETLYPAGTLLTIPAGASHWLAARGGDVRLQLIVLDDENVTPAVQEQMQ